MAKAWAMRPLRFVGVPLTGHGSAAGYDPVNVGNDHMGVVWKAPTGLTQTYVQVDLGSAQAIDAALWLGCTDAKSTWTMAVTAASDSAFTTGVWIDPRSLPFLAGSQFPTHGRGVALWETDPAAPAPARRYWRFWTANMLTSEQLTIGRLVFGQRVQLERNFVFGGAFGVRDLGRVDFSANGVLLRRRASKLRTLGISFPYVHKEEIEEKVQPLIEMCAGQEPVALVTDPEPHAQRQKRCWFGPMVGELGTIWRTPRSWEWRANLIDLVAIPKSS